MLQPSLRKNKGAWVQAATRTIFTTQIPPSPFFPAGRRGEETLSPLGLEDLQTDNGVQTALKNITSLEQRLG